MITMRKILWSGLILLLTASGCTAIEREAERRTPKASIESTHIAGFDFDAARLLVNVRVDNPNPVAINIAGLDYELRLGGERVLSGGSTERAKISARGSGNVTIPVTLDYRDLSNRVAGLRGRDRVDYSIDLGILVNVPLLGERRLPASASGTIPVPQRPRIALRDLRVERLDFNGARLMLDVAVGNPNTFDLALDTFRYRLNVNGNDWASGALRDMARVDAGERATLSIPIELDFSTIGSGVRQMLLTGGRVDYDLSGVLSGTAGQESLGDFELPFEDAGGIGITP